jgi:hypothetical protein
VNGDGPSEESNMASSDAIRWGENLEAAIARAGSERRHVLVDFSAAPM